MSHEQDQGQGQDQDLNDTTQSHQQHPVSDWLEESISFLPSFFGEPYAIADDIASYDWWTNDESTAIHVPPPPVDSVSPAPAPTSIASSPVSPVSPVLPLEFSKKRKAPANAPGHHQRRRASAGENGESEKEGESYVRKPSAGKKGHGKGGGASSDKHARWAEQLLNPCAAAIEAGNLSRAQHLFYVLGELASFSGEANHRLAAHGLRALALRLPAAVGPAAAAAVRVPAAIECPTPCFAAAEPRLFRAALIKFHEVSPWFALPNALANAAIAQAAAPRPLHVVDIGVSHGVQWPTLLESLTRLPGNHPPPSVRLTIAGTPAVPFSASPPAYDFSPHLLRYAKSINLNLSIDRAASLESVHGCLAVGEVLVVCIQFRLGHASADQRTDILRAVRSLNPELVVLSELDGSGGGGGGGFEARLEMLWRFLESTAAAFKGRESEERRVMEAEAGRTVAMDGEAAVEGRDTWRERMACAGFEESAFGGEAVETAKSLLRKYDSGWELVPPPPPQRQSPAAKAAGHVGLRWKGQPVSFCSLWRPAT